MRPNRLRQYLKPALANSLLEAIRPLLPPSATVVIAGNEGILASLGQEESDPAQIRPLTIDGVTIGQLRVSATEVGSGWADCLATLCQAMMEQESAKRAVTQETLNSYREVAMLQRAALDLNHSLKPDQVAEVLLREFARRIHTAQWGAILLLDEETESFQRIRTFGPEADQLFAAWQASPFFQGLRTDQWQGILNQARHHPLATAESAFAGALLAMALPAQGRNLGWIILASPQEDAFVAADMKLVETVASVAATALNNARLFEAEKRMFHSFVDAIAVAIDAKSPYTAGHCRRVPELARMLAEAAHEQTDGRFQGFILDEEGAVALEVASKLHDCGKLTTPEWVLDKSSKLETICDRIELIALRVALAKRELEIRQNGIPNPEAMRQWDETLAFLRRCNQGEEFLTDAAMERLQQLVPLTWRDENDQWLPLLTPDELANLSIRRGTLNLAERQKIEDHALHTISLLNQVRFPHALRQVTEFAGNHHERLDGSGYPRHLQEKDLSLPARMIAFADIFEALTAPDRPYRGIKTLNWALGIMQRMKVSRHIDADIFELFLREGLYLEYARRYLRPEQIDRVDIEQMLATG